jgi:hypothetical protein
VLSTGKYGSFSLRLHTVLTPWSRVLEKLNGFSKSRNSPHFMEPEGTLACLQVTVTCPYPEPDQSSPCPIPLSEDPYEICLFVYAWGEIRRKKR